MPLPTTTQLLAHSNKITMYASQYENYKHLSTCNIGEVAEAYKTLAIDFEWKVRKAISDLWLYINDSITELPSN
jgi:hypothetical protein